MDDSADFSVFEQGREKKGFPKDFCCVMKREGETEGEVEGLGRDLARMCRSGVVLPLEASGGRVPVCEGDHKARLSAGRECLVSVLAE